MRILLAEDDQFYAQVITDVLRDSGDHGTRVDCVGTAQDALRKYSRRYDAVILDSMLPDNPDLSGLSEKETQGGFDQESVSLGNCFRETPPRAFSCFQLTQ